MIFAALVDSGLIPFLAFSAWLAQADYTTNAYGWSTLFKDSDVSYKIIYAFFLISCTEGGLIVASLLMDVYLAIKFKQIARMPPDMNPLEDNLTSRTLSRHKRDKSEGITQKNMQNSALVAKRDADMSGFKRVPFIHTRTDSADSITLYGNESARNSRVEFRKELDDSGKDPWRFSKASTTSPSRPGSAVNPSPNSRPAGLGLDNRTERASSPLKSSRPSSWLSYIDYEGVPTPMSPEASAELNHEVRPVSPISHDPSVDRRLDERENWYQGPAAGSPNHLPITNTYYLPQSTNRGALETTLGTVVHSPGQQKKRSREPLAMNPPTPVRRNFNNENLYSTPVTETRNIHSYDPNRVALQDTNENVQARPAVGPRPSSFVGSGGKARFYGNLRSSIGSVSSAVDKKEPQVTTQEYDPFGRTKTMQSESDYSVNFEVYASDDDDEELRANIASNQSVLSRPQTEWNGVRQTSNSTGYDLDAGYAGLGVEFGRGMGRRRDVSGKVAEEGRASPVRSPGRNGAAGWERFKGL
jgi:hypothetical protein